MTDPDLFGGALRPQRSGQTPRRATRRVTGTTAAPRSVDKPAGGTPRAAAEALSDIHDGQLGVLDNTGRVVRFTDDEQVRHSVNDGVITALTRSGYVTEDDSGRVSCRHGAVRRPVVPLKLTRSGKVLLERWAALQGTGTRRTD